MKAHITVGAYSDPVHHRTRTAANVHELRVVNQLLCNKEAIPSPTRDIQQLSQIHTVAKICLIGPTHISRNPRLVRNAECLAAAGHEVVVVYPEHLPGFLEHDHKITDTTHWKIKSIDFLSSPLSRLNLFAVRLRSKVFSQVQLKHRPFLARSYGYFGPELARAASKIRADFYIAQQQVTAMAAATAARQMRAPFAIDVEDLLSEHSEEASEALRAIERRLFTRCAFLCTMSYPAAEHLASQYPLEQPPVVLHNCMSTTEAKTLAPPSCRQQSSILSLYWFGQTIGPHCCAEQILHAAALLPFRVQLTLRGNFPRDGYISSLLALEEKLQISGTLQIEAGASPDEMVRLAGEHDICFGTQPSGQLFHELAIGNKVFTGMMAGCAVALSDTIAHRHLIQQKPGWAFLFRNEDPSSLADQLIALKSDSSLLQEMRSTAWNVAHAYYCWEKESQNLVAAVERTLSRTVRT
ncbi:MAG: glycosyltransferase [Rubrivivax sp.]|nr:glycosyltransferase [Rubrivivax sp.]